MPAPNTIERLMGYVDRQGPDECWPWTGPISNQGYGNADLHRKRAKAHRFVYEQEVGPIPPGMVIDHLCRVRHCVNPAHMEVVTSAENTKRGARPFSFDGHCKSGRHVIAGPEDVVPSSGSCRECAKERDREKSELLQRAARSLGMTHDAYRKSYGSSRDVARSILGGA
jgi:hypothetical protein